MGKYIGEIYKAIVGGATKEQALATAADWYAQTVLVRPLGLNIGNNTYVTLDNTRPDNEDAPTSSALK
jgi:hypothetical protein